MSVSIVLNCDGCEASTQGGSMYRHLGPRVGHSLYLRPTLEAAFEAAVPDGWVAYDPWTYCTYCPDCWESIVVDTAAGVHVVSGDDR